jgi:predicted SAM-dependent methyltransferase
MKLDIACGQSKAPGFTGIDIAALPGVDIRYDLRHFPWPIADASVEEAYCSHYLEHVPRLERPHFFNEVYRILKPEAGIVLVTPLDLMRQCQDFTHEWPPIFPESYAYLDREWRESKGLSHYEDLYGIRCDFKLYACRVRMGDDRVLDIDPQAVYLLGRQYALMTSDLIIVLQKR